MNVAFPAGLVAKRTLPSSVIERAQRTKRTARRPRAHPRNLIESQMALPLADGNNSEKTPEQWRRIELPPWAWGAQALPLCNHCMNSSEQIDPRRARESSLRAGAPWGVSVYEAGNPRLPAHPVERRGFAPR